MVNEKSISRANVLDNVAITNNEEKKRISAGLDFDVTERTQASKAKILKYFNATEQDWNSYAWQMKNRITDPDTLNDIIGLDEKVFNEVKKVNEINLWSISPYYLSLVNFQDTLDPIGLICTPNILECNEEGEADPMCEEFTSPADFITRRYPDRVILNVTNMCGMYCRFCQRKRNFQKVEVQQSPEDLTDALKYIADTPTIRDVLVTGGDPLTLSTAKLEQIISEIRSNKHVEIIRLGTRIPVTVPQRVDKELVDMLKKYHPIFVNTHFNHPREITAESKRACDMLADAGIPLGNQSVLLNGVNNNKYVFLRLNQELLKCRVRPYYIFLSKKVIGTTHFNCHASEGMDIIEFLRGNTSGLAIPHFIVNAPGGLGKVPLQKQNCEFVSDTEMLLRTWEGKEVICHNKATDNINELYGKR